MEAGQCHSASVQMRSCEKGALNSLLGSCGGGGGGQAMASGTSRMLLGAPTSHTRTAVDVAERLTSATFDLRLRDPEEPDGLWLLECVGSGL